ncbi:MAG: MFS transporter [Myxococcales bacterium]|nr:MFS transporter [Myxococcales bacterium]
MPSRDPEREAAFQSEVRRNLRRNYLSHLCHGLLGQTGMRLVNAPTFVPVYIASLAGFDAAVGLARGLQYLGMSLSPVVGATVIEHRRRVLPVGFVVGALMRVQILGLALSGLLLPAPWSLVSAWLFLGLFGAFLGVQGVVFSFLVAKVIPVEKRGVLLGLRNALAGATAAGVAFLAGRYLIEPEALGNGYAATFLLAFGLTSLGLLVLLFVREPATPQVREAARVGQRLRELPALLRSDRSFTRYFVARALAVTGRMGVPFYVLYAAERVPLGGRRLGELTAAFVVGQSVGNLFWGLVADRRGFRAVFLAALTLWMLAALLLMSTTSYAALLLVFTALGAGLGGFQMSAQNLVLEFGSRRNLPMRIAVANSASELVAAIGAVLGGVLAGALSYVAVFWIAIAFQTAAFAMVAFFVDDPRHRT